MCLDRSIDFYPVALIKLRHAKEEFSHCLLPMHYRCAVSCSTWQSPRRPQVVQSALQGPRGS